MGPYADMVGCPPRHCKHIGKNACKNVCKYVCAYACKCIRTYTPRGRDSHALTTRLYRGL